MKCLRLYVVSSWTAVFCHFMRQCSAQPGDLRSVLSLWQSPSFPNAFAQDSRARPESLSQNNRSASEKVPPHGFCEKPGYLPLVETVYHYYAVGITSTATQKQTVPCHPRMPCRRPDSICMWSDLYKARICCVTEETFNQNLPFVANDIVPVTNENDPRTSKIIRQARLLTNLLPPTVDATKPGPGIITSEPLVTPLIFGDIEVRVKPGSYKFPSSVVWVQDTKDGVRCTCDIIVDTGLPTDKNSIISCLAQHGRKPEDIEYVVVTHGHPDHFGNQNLFPHAKVFFNQMEIDGAVFNDALTSFIPSRDICDNTALYLTPGHTSGDISLVVKKVQGFGNIAIVGDLFSNEKDLKQSELWKQFSFDVAMQQTNRNMMLCIADYIIPGHGKTFPVTAEMKNEAGCSTSSN